MDNDKRTALDLYLNRVYKLIIFGSPFTALSAGIFVTLFYCLGYYPNIHLAALIIFDIINVSYFLLVYLLYRKSEDENGRLKEGRVLRCKLLFLIVILVQWNYLSYMVQSRELWGFALFFISITCLFIDHKFVAITAAGVLASVAISWIILPNALLPVNDAYYLPNIILRCIALFFGSLTLWVVTFLVQMCISKELDKLANHDSLTNLFGKRTIESLYKDANAKALKYKRNFNVLLINIDDFRLINEKYGHSCGDEVLKSVASIVLEDIHNKGVAARVDTDGILVFLDLEKKDSNDLAYKIHEDVEKSSINYGGTVIKSTITIGCAERKDNSMTFDELVNAVQERLMFGKKRGKNLVILDEK